MSIKPDTWIRRMAREHGMIEPFEEKLVRQVDNRPVISYGVSSYGYDVRVADEFRVFTNVFSSIVDPKQFDPKSLVEVNGPTCLIPPNSFALAVSVETFRIPRNHLRGQIDLRPMRHHRQRNSVRTWLGRPRGAGNLEYDATARQNLRRRGLGSSLVLRERRTVREILCRSKRQVPEPNRSDAAQDVAWPKTRRQYEYTDRSAAPRLL